MPIVKNAIAYECDHCQMKFLDDKDVFIIDGALSFAGAKFGIDDALEVVCPTCFINKMFAETGNLEALIEIVDEHEEEIVEEDKGGFANDDYDWETEATEVVEDGFKVDENTVIHETGWDITDLREENEIEEEFE